MKQQYHPAVNSWNSHIIQQSETETATLQLKQQYHPAVSGWNSNTTQQSAAETAIPPSSQRLKQQYHPAVSGWNSSTTQQSAAETAIPPSSQRLKQQYHPAVSGWNSNTTQQSAAETAILPSSQRLKQQYHPAVSGWNSNTTQQLEYQSQFECTNSPDSEQWSRLRPWQRCVEVTAGTSPAGRSWHWRGRSTGTGRSLCPTSGSQCAGSSFPVGQTETVHVDCYKPTSHIIFYRQCVSSCIVSASHLQYVQFGFPPLMCILSYS